MVDAEGIQENEVPESPPICGQCVLVESGKRQLTCDGHDDLQVDRGSGRQDEFDGSLVIGPGDLEGLAGCDAAVGRVGQFDLSVDDGREGSDESDS